MPKKAYKGPPTELDFEKALMFFHAYMYGPLQGKLRLYGARKVRSVGAAMTSDWEVFASMLVGDLGRKLAGGIDLSTMRSSPPTKAEPMSISTTRTPARKSWLATWRSAICSSIMRTT